MDDLRFDDLTRSLARETSRRGVLKLFFGGAVGLLAGGTFGVRGGGVGIRQAEAAGCRPTNAVSVACGELSDYVAACGVVCPSGRRLVGKGGCTEGQVRQGDADFSRVKAGKRPKVRCGCQTAGKPFCAKGPVTVVWDVPVAPTYTTIDLTLTDDACCGDVCQAEVGEVMAALAAHEQGHVANIHRAAAEASTAWQDRAFAACGATKAKAVEALTAEVRAALKATKERVQRTIEEEPPQARLIDCGKCQAGSGCCDGACCDCPSGQFSAEAGICCEEGLVACGVECCYEEQGCHNGTCGCGPDGSVCAAADGSGAFTCCAAGERCCGGVCKQDCGGQCCPAGSKCCYGSCIAEAEACYCEQQVACGDPPGHCCYGKACCEYSNPNGAGRCCFDPSIGETCNPTSGCS